MKLACPWRIQPGLILAGAVLQDRAPGNASSPLGVVVRRQIDQRVPPSCPVTFELVPDLAHLAVRDIWWVE